MKTERTAHSAGTITNIAGHRPRRANFGLPVSDGGQPQPELALLPDLRDTNARGAIEIINRTLQTF